jgi:hypothetical protein
VSNPFIAAWSGSTPPDYTAVYLWRQEQLKMLQREPFMLAGAMEYYRTHSADFIEHWCDTYDPRLASSTRPSHMPFILFKRQRELIYWSRNAATWARPG